MPIKPLKYFKLLLLVNSLPLFSQLQVMQYPVRFSQYYNCYQVINPAHIGSYEKIDIATGDKHLLGNFSKISTYYLAASVRIDPQLGFRNNSFSAIGVFIYNDREGKYLNRTRIYATYAWHGKITKKLRVSGGFHLGAANYSVKGTPLTGDGSDIVPDGTVGVQLYSNKFHFGLSYNQLFNNSIQPLEEVAKLSSYLNFDGSLKINVSPLVLITPSYSWRIPVNNDKMLYDFTLMGSYNNIFALAIGIHDNNKIMNTFELRNKF